MEEVGAEVTKLKESIAGKSRTESKNVWIVIGGLERQ